MIHTMKVNGLCNEVLRDVKQMANYHACWTTKVHEGQHTCACGRRW